jgi:peroxiredoxin
MKRKILMTSLLLLTLVFVSACTTNSVKQAESNSETSTDWKDTTLTDVQGNTFKVSDFQGKPVLLESFAVWCPTCTKQQKEIMKLHEELGDGFVSIALATDPNEDKQKVMEHAEKNNLDLTYVISPPSFTQNLISEFGVVIANAPAVPVILVCENQESRLLQNGLKSPQELKEEIEKGC